MYRGQKVVSSLSKRVTRFQPRETSPPSDENAGRARSGRTSLSVAAVTKDRDARAAKRRRILEDVHQPTPTSTEAGNLDDPDADAWEDDLPGLAEVLAAVSDDSLQASIMVDMSQGGFIASTIARKRVDARTRAEQLQAQELAWEEAMPRLVVEYMAWKHRAAVARDTPASAAAPAQAAEPANPKSNSFTVAAVCDNSFERHLCVEQADGETAAVSLMRAGMMACAPLAPGVAISLRILDLYYRLRRRAPRLGVLPFVRALCDIHMCSYRPFLREQFAAAFDRYVAILREVQRRVSGALGRDMPHWRALNACSPCTYNLEEEPALAIPRLLAMDGGQSMKRSAAAGSADSRVYHSDYRVPPEEVDRHADEVRRRVVPKKKRGAETEAPAFVALNEPGEPGDDAPAPSLCAHRWKNAKAEHHKIAPGMYHQTGMFVIVCRHGHVIWFTEMISSGELAKYPLGIISRMLRVGLRGTRCAYDIGCAFQGTLDRSSLGQAAKDAAITCGLNSFHGYGHNRLCQLGHHPLYQPGFGLEDLETCERFFSWINGVGGVVRHASHYRWLQAIDLGIQQWDDDKYHELSKFLLNNVRQAVRIKEEYGPLVSEFKRRTGLADADIEGWLGEERAYLQGLQTEPEEVGLKMDYLTLLGELKDAETALASKQADYKDGLRAPSQQEIAKKRLSPAAVKKLYKARVDAYDKYMKTVDAVVTLEGVLGIDVRWTATSPEYQEGLVQMAERDWRRALDRLELLMVQRMFELAKSHVFGTGYKLREAIGKGLKSRSQAIRTAVSRYNELAEALNPPAATVNFSTLMEWTELQEFELLRSSRSGDVREKAWAQPANRLIASKHYKLLRADEELVRCRVEARRLVTAMRDEERQFDETHARLSSSNPALAHELREFVARRTTVNDQHRAYLAKLAAIPGFEGILVPGIRLGGPRAPAPAPAPGREHSPPPDSHTSPLRAASVPLAPEPDPLFALDDNDGVEVEEEERNTLHDFIAAVDD